MDITLLRSFSTTRRVKTGTWSRFQPAFLSSVSPCMFSCPLSVDVPRLIDLCLKEDFKRAAETLMEFNPFPFITGRVCPGFCEKKCNRGEFDEAVSIREIERFLGDFLLSERIFPAKSRFLKKKVAVVGSGPSGLSAAWFLARLGFEVNVFERENVFGGLLRLGIPPYRLSKDVVEKLVARLEEFGVRFTAGVSVGKKELEDLLSDFSYVVLAVGLWAPRRLKIENEELCLTGLDVLKSFNLGGELPEGKRFIVIGGGNAAVDVARVLRKADREVLLVCVEPRSEMPAIEEEVEAAVSEGVKILDSHSVVSVRAEDGRVCGARLVPVKIIGEKNGLKEVEPAGEAFELDADGVVLCAGHEREVEFSEGERVFFCGDYVLGPSSVAEAVASGREVAAAIAEKEGLSFFSVSQLWKRDLGDVVEFSQLNLWYFEKKPKVESIKTKDDLLFEASRCFSCGFCNFCGNCWIFCPDVSIELTDEGPRLDPDHCKGCGICASECPRSVVKMRPKY